MTPRQIDAMKLALEALEDRSSLMKWQKARDAIKEVLAEHAMSEVQRLGQEIEQEPVAWRNAAIRVGEDLSSVGPDGYYDMTAQQWLDWAMEQQPHGKNSLAQPDQYAKGYADAMNWKVQNHLEHLPTAQPEQEPVAWRAPNWGHGDDEWVYRDFDDPVLIADGKPSPNNEPLYTNPLKRQWVGLTDEEIKEIVGPYGDIPIKGYTRKLFYQIEAKLEEKNT